LLAFASWVWAQDEKERYSASHDAGNDDEQQGATKCWSFFRRRGGGGGHRYLDAKCGSLRIIKLRGE